MKALALHRLGVEEAPRLVRICGGYRGKDPERVDCGGDREQWKARRGSARLSKTRARSRALARLKALSGRVRESQGS